MTEMPWNDKRFDQEAFDRLPLGSVLTPYELHERNLNPWLFARTIRKIENGMAEATFTKVK